MIAQTEGHHVNVIRNAHIRMVRNVFVGRYVTHTIYDFITHYSNIESVLRVIVEIIGIIGSSH